MRAGARLQMGELLQEGEIAVIWGQSGYGCGGCGVESRKRCGVDVGWGQVLGECEEQVQLWEGGMGMNRHVGIGRFASLGVCEALNMEGWYGDAWESLRKMVRWQS